MGLLVFLKLPFKRCLKITLITGQLLHHADIQVSLLVIDTNFLVTTGALEGSVGPPVVTQCLDSHDRDTTIWTNELTSVMDHLLMSLKRLGRLTDGWAEITHSL